LVTNQIVKAFATKLVVVRESDKYAQPAAHDITFGMNNIFRILDNKTIDKKVGSN
jgi:hypothetical protein